MFAGVGLVVVVFVVVVVVVAALTAKPRLAPRVVFETVPFQLLHQGGVGQQLQ